MEIELLALKPEQVNNLRKGLSGAGVTTEQAINSLRFWSEFVSKTDLLKV